MRIKETPRLWELDALRGIAIILMVLFHAVFNLKTFFGVECADYQNGLWFWVGRIAGVLFIVLVGVVSSLIAKKEGSAGAAQKNSRRGLRLIALGLIITLITFIVVPENTIWFGILHFLGLSILISMPMGGYRWKNVALAIVLLAAYWPMQNYYADNHLGLIFGLAPPAFSSYDYYALIPWFSFVLIGIALGNWIYPKGRPLIKRAPTILEKSLIETGKYSLWIYFIHQPVLLGAFWLYFRFL